MTLSVVMVAYNSAGVVEGALQSVRGLWDELLVGVGGSTDGTVGVVREYGGKVIRQIRQMPQIRQMDSSENLGARKQQLVEMAKGEWILVLDADEQVSPKLFQEITSLTHSPRRSLALRLRSGLPPCEVVNAVAYKIPYQNYVFGKPVYWGGERYAKVRLFRRGFGRISPEELHEEVVIESVKTGFRLKGRNDDMIGEFRGKIHHHSYRTPWQLFTKFTRYAWITARQMKWQGETLSFAKLFLYGPHMFWARYIKEKGYKDGWRGLVLASAFGYMEGLTYWLLFLRDILLLAILVSFHFWILGKTKFIVFEEMFSYGWFIKKGLTLYRDVGVMYPPGAFYLLYLVYSVFGFTFWTFQGLVYSLVAITDVVLFVIARSWFGSRLITAAILVFYFMWHMMLDGKVLWFETMLTPALLLALFFFWKYKRENQSSPLVFSGIFFSIALLIKQPSAYPLAATILFIVLGRRESVRKKIINISYLLLFPVLSAIAITLMLLRQGLLVDFLYWIWYVPTSVYARHGYYLLRPRRPDLYAILPLLLIFLIGLIVSVMRRRTSRLRLLVSWGIAANLFAYPRWGNFHLLPFVAVSSLIFGESIRHVVQARTTWWIKVVVLWIFIGTTFALSAREMKHFLIDINPKIVPYSPERHALLAEKIKRVTGNGRVYSFENVHLVYFMMDSVPTVLPWLSVSPIVEMMPELQYSLVSQLEDDRVDYLAYFPYGNESLADDRAIPLVFKQMVERRYLLYKKETFPEPFMIYKKQL